MRLPFAPAMWMAAVLTGTFAGVPERLSAASDEDDIIIESRAQGQNFDRYREVEGTWQDSQVPPSVSKSSAPGLTPGEQCGVRKVLFLSAEEPNRKPEVAAARFHPRPGRPGRYHVYVTWPKSANATPVYYTVRHADGEKRIPLTQEGRSKRGPGNANQWISLGSYHFAPGDDHYVELRIGLDVKPADGDYRGQVIADSVRFTKTPIESIEARPAQVPSAPKASSAAGASRASAPPPSAPAFQWKDSIEEGMAEAARSRKRILVCFLLPGSTVSDRLLETVFEAPRVRSELARDYVTVRLNIAEHGDLATRLGVYRGGSVVVYTHDGQALGQITDASDPAQFLARLAELGRP